MALLLSYSAQNAIKKISDNYSETKYNELAKEVEDLEVTKLIGGLFLQDLIANPTETYNKKLLDGDSLESGQTHKGLKYIIAYLNYSRYVGSSYYKDTYTGFKKQKNEESEFLNEGEIKRIQNLYVEMAMTAWEVVKDWLDENTDNFEYWDIAKTTKVYKPILYGLKKTSK